MTTNYPVWKWVETAIAVVNTQSPYETNIFSATFSKVLGYDGVPPTPGVNALSPTMEPVGRYDVTVNEPVTAIYITAVFGDENIGRYLVPAENQDFTEFGLNLDVTGLTINDGNYWTVYVTHSPFGNIRPLSWIEPAPHRPRTVQ